MTELRPLSNFVTEQWKTLQKASIIIQLVSVVPFLLGHPLIALGMIIVSFFILLAAFFEFRAYEKEEEKKHCSNCGKQFTSRCQFMLYYSDGRCSDWEGRQ